jgi:hypothetical protein
MRFHRVDRQQCSHPGAAGRARWPIWSILGATGLDILVCYLVPERRDDAAPALRSSFTVIGDPEAGSSPLTVSWDGSTLLSLSAVPGGATRLPRAALA